MARGRQRDEWDRSARLVATLNNLWSQKKVRERDVHPFYAGKRERPRRTLKNPAELGMGGIIGVVQ